MSDMIDRKRLLDFLDTAEHDAEERDWRSGVNEIARIRKYVAALPPADDVPEEISILLGTVEHLQTRVADLTRQLQGQPRRPQDVPDAVDGDAALHIDTALAMAKVQDGYARKATCEGEKIIFKANAKAQRQIADYIRRMSSPAPDAPLPATVAHIVPENCTGTALVFDPGTLHINKDGSGYIAIDEKHFECEDDRTGEGGSVHWITRMDASEMTALRDFLIKGTLHAPDAGAALVKAAEAHNAPYASQSMSKAWAAGYNAALAAIRAGGKP